jgi:hypothetical protein
MTTYRKKNTKKKGLKVSVQEEWKVARKKKKNKQMWEKREEEEPYRYRDICGIKETI